MRKAAVLIAFFLAYVCLLVGINILHFRYVAVDVVFYAALADAIIACLILCILAATAHKLSKRETLVGGVIHQLTGTEITLLAIVALLVGYILAISVPTVIDRSFSIYILEKLDQRGGAISLDAMNDIVLKEFAREHRLIDARMTEQLRSGTVSIEDDCVRLTPWGKRIVHFTRIYRTNLLPKNRVLMGQVSSDLVDPFRNPVSLVDYRCKGKQTPATGGHE